MFALADEYIFLLHHLRGAKKRLRKEKINTATLEKLEEIQAAYLLLDIHVYSRHNAWEAAADAIFTFLNISFNFIDFKDILYLIEGGFYRVIFSYFIYRN